MAESRCKVVPDFRALPETRGDVAGETLECGGRARNERRHRLRNVPPAGAARLPTRNPLQRRRGAVASRRTPRLSPEFSGVSFSRSSRARHSCRLKSGTTLVPRESVRLILKDGISRAPAVRTPRDHRAAVVNCTGSLQRLQRPELSFIRTRARYVVPECAASFGNCMLAAKVVISGEIHALSIS